MPVPAPIAGRVTVENVGGAFRADPDPVGRRTVPGVHGVPPRAFRFSTGATICPATRSAICPATHADIRWITVPAWLAGAAVGRPEHLVILRSRPNLRAAAPCRGGVRARSAPLRMRLSRSIVGRVVKRPVPCHVLPDLLNTVSILSNTMCDIKPNPSSWARSEDVAAEVLNFLTVIFPYRYSSCMFEVLVEPRRRRILDLLRGGEQTVGDLVSELGMSQPGVSKHLRILREAGLVKVRADGQRRLYRLRTEPLREIDEWLAPYRASWSNRLDALEAHLEEMQE